MCSTKFTISVFPDSYSCIYFAKKIHFALKITSVLDKQFTFEKLVSLLHTCACNVTLKDATVALRLTTRIRRAGVICFHSAVSETKHITLGHFLSFHTCGRVLYFGRRQTSVKLVLVHQTPPHHIEVYNKCIRSP